MKTDLQPAAARAQGGNGVEIAYVLAFILAEIVGYGRPLAGGICEAILLVVLVNHAAAVEREGPRPLLLGLAVVCLYRLLSLTPVSGNPLIDRLALVGAPTLLAALLALRCTRTPARGLAERPAGWEGIQLLIALSGVPLSWAAYKILKPSVVVTFSGAGHATMGTVILAVVLLVVFSGVTEEIIFRSLVHRAARGAFGTSALYVSALVFGAAYLGTRSLAMVAFVVAVGAFFGWCYERTDSVLGIALAHAAISVGVFVVWPSLVGHIHL